MMTTAKSQNTALIAALQWHVDNHAAFAWAESPVDATSMPELETHKKVSSDTLSKRSMASEPVSSGPGKPDEKTDIEGTAQLRSESIALAEKASNLDELKSAIAEFDGLSIKKTASNLVFADGNPDARVMIIGEAPGADEDRQGLPFVGKSGQLLDRIFASINLERHAEDPSKALYITNILNWRPPGNRTPTPAEIEISLPFIEKHIALINPDILVLCGGISAKALLNESRGITKLRGQWVSFTPQTLKTPLKKEIQALATFHPSFLLRNPAQKKAVWQDMLSLQRHLPPQKT